MRNRTQSFEPNGWRTRPYYIAAGTGPKSGREELVGSTSPCTDHRRRRAHRICRDDGLEERLLERLEPQLLLGGDAGSHDGTFERPHDTDCVRRSDPAFGW